MLKKLRGFIKDHHGCYSAFYELIVIMTALVGSIAWLILKILKSTGVGF